MLKSIAILVLCTGLFAEAYAADTVRLTAAGRNKLARVSGEDNGLASELFTCFDKAGFPLDRQQNSDSLQGKFLSAQREKSDVTRFTAQLTIDPAVSAMSVDVTPPHFSITINGEIAKELYAALEKAGYPFDQYIEGRAFKGKFTKCTVLILGGKARYACSLSSREQ